MEVERSLTKTLKLFLRPFFKPSSGLLYPHNRACPKYPSCVKNSFLWIIIVFQLHRSSLTVFWIDFFLLLLFFSCPNWDHAEFGINESFLTVQLKQILVYLFLFVITRNSLSNNKLIICDFVKSSVTPEDYKYTHKKK